MAKKKTVFGNCALCGEYKELTFEHVPPQSAFNDKPIFVQGFEHLVDTGGHLYGKKRLSNRGFGSHTLCDDCNSRTGGWYGGAFVAFAKQGMDILKSTNPIPYAVSGKYTIKPNNVLKQITTMFFSADKAGILREFDDLLDFVQIKEKTGFPKDFKVYLYSNCDPHKRMMGYTAGKFGKQFAKWAEINFCPFGYLLAHESGPAHEHMVDISPFGDLEYDEQADLEISIPYLIVETPIIGQYKNQLPYP